MVAMQSIAIRDAALVAACIAQLAGIVTRAGAVHAASWGW